MKKSHIFILVACFVVYAVSTFYQVRWFRDFMRMRNESLSAMVQPTADPDTFVGNRVATQPSNFGTAVSSTSFVTNTTTPILISPSRQARYFGLLQHRSVGLDNDAVYIYFGPTSTASTTLSYKVSGRSSLPYVEEMGLFTAYYGPLTLIGSASNSSTGTILWLEKAR